jgi:hypothetical protein
VVVGDRRGRPNVAEPDHPLTELDRVRELAPLVAASLVGEDILGASIALHRRSAALGVEVVHARVVSGPDSTELDLALTLLLTAEEELIGVVRVGGNGSGVLLRNDEPWRSA